MIAFKDGLSVANRYLINGDIDVGFSLARYLDEPNWLTSRLGVFQGLGPDRERENTRSPCMFSAIGARGGQERWSSGFARRGHAHYPVDAEPFLAMHESLYAILGDEDLGHFFLLLSGMSNLSRTVQVFLPLKPPVP
jgi:hypothetical protein